MVYRKPKFQHLISKEMYIDEIVGISEGKCFRGSYVIRGALCELHGFVGPVYNREKLISYCYDSDSKMKRNSRIGNWLTTWAKQLIKNWKQQYYGQDRRKP